MPRSTPAVPRAEERVRDAAAVELADREQVERGDEEAHPARERHRVHEDVHALAGWGRTRIQVSSRMSSESPNVMVPAPAAPSRPATTAGPRSRAGTATTSPASGPGHRDVEERVPVPRRRAHADDRAQGAEQEDRRRRRDEERQAHRRPVVAGREVVAELVGAQDGEEREREGHAVEQAARPQERIEGEERQGARDQAARGERGEHGEHEEEEVDARAASAPSRRRAAPPGATPGRPGGARKGV